MQRKFPVWVPPDGSDPSRVVLVTPDDHTRINELEELLLERRLGTQNPHQQKRLDLTLSLFAWASNDQRAKLSALARSTFKDWVTGPPSHAAASRADQLTNLVDSGWNPTGHAHEGFFEDLSLRVNMVLAATDDPREGLRLNKLRRRMLRAARNQPPDERLTYLGDEVSLGRLRQVHDLLGGSDDLLGAVAGWPINRDLHQGVREQRYQTYLGNAIGLDDEVSPHRPLGATKQQALVLAWYFAGPSRRADPRWVESIDDAWSLFGRPDGVWAARAALRTAEESHRPASPTASDQAKQRSSPGGSPPTQGMCK